MEQAQQAKLPTVDEATAKLADFFELNPYSTLAATDSGDDLEILTPWGDASVVLEIEDGFELLSEALNAVKLPERFSALWHKDDKRLEVIWTAYKLPESQKEIHTRSFVFAYCGTEHKCEFGKSSERLMTIARHTKPRMISDTNHRNVQSFAAYERLRKRDGGIPHESFDDPRSFWISDVEWDEVKVVEMVNHLNFHMRYFDGQTPTVLVHPATNEPMVPKRTRYIRGDFPAHIDCQALDENMLSFWSFAESGNPMLRFLLYYRILEYGAYHFVEDEVREELKRIILAPDLKSNVNRSIGSMMSAMGAMKLSDAQRLRALVRRAVRRELIWRDLKANIEFFSKDTSFDGGFTVRAPIGKNHTEESFSANDLEKVVDRFRDIRNALSHGKDQETSGVIRPTPENVNLFRPWVHLIATAAGEVVLHGTHT
jgi:hypothetical protein